MSFPDGYIDLPNGKIASVVTYLEMKSPPDPLPAVDLPDGYSIRRIEKPDPGWYRDLFRAVGQEFLWFSRLGTSDQALIAAIHSTCVEIYVLEQNGEPRGLVELDRQHATDVELQLFGVTPDRVGQGLGKPLMAFAMRAAWSGPTKRFHLHTCTLDHPNALGFYRKSGFQAYKRGIEVSMDPRLTGALPRSSAAWIPIIEP